MKKVGLSSILIAVVLLAVAVIAEAQQQTKVTKIGWLAASGRLPQFDDYKNALRALGYIILKEKASLSSIKSLGMSPVASPPWRRVSPSQGRPNSRQRDDRCSGRQERYQDDSRFYKRG
jgi:hypothetical protein